MRRFSQWMVNSPCPVMSNVPRWSMRIADIDRILPLRSRNAHHLILDPSASPSAGFRAFGFHSRLPSCIRLSSHFDSHTSGRSRTGCSSICCYRYLPKSRGGAKSHKQRHWNNTGSHYRIGDHPTLVSDKLCCDGNDSRAWGYDRPHGKARGTMTCTEGRLA